MQKKNTFPLAMTIAGSDSGGGAGIQADLRTFSYFRVYGASAVTAATFQNPLEVTGIEPLSPTAVKEQIKTVMKELSVTAVKTGMLFSGEIVEAVCDALKNYRGALVVDPVMMSTSGKKLMCDSAVGVLRDRLLPMASWITPNLPEAEVLAGMKIASREDALRAACFCAERWDCSVVLKGGHSEGKNASDIVVHKGDTRLLSTPRVEVRRNSDHGIGCTFSAALTALLAKGEDWESAVHQAKAFVTASLLCAVPISESGIHGMFPPRGKLVFYCKQVSCVRI